MVLRFFLGANSGEGFFSLYPQLCREEARRIFVIKSGPGSGKSTAMRTLAKALGDAQEEILCSSDPASLDGVVFPDLALLDGTAPHVTEPDFPGAGGDYLTLPPYRDRAALEQKRPALLALKAASAQCYAQAWRLLSAAARVREARRQLLEPSMDQARLAARGRSLMLRSLPETGRPGRLRLRFLEGYTPQGKLLLAETAAACAQRIWTVGDRFGLAQPLLQAARDAALERGQLVYACLDPLEPGRLRHLLLPEAGLALMTREETPLPLPVYRSLRVDAMIPPETLRLQKGRLRLLGQTGQALEEEALGYIAQTHRLHDEMEAIYRPHLALEEMEQCLLRQQALLRP